MSFPLSTVYSSSSSLIALAFMSFTAFFALLHPAALTLRLAPTPPPPTPLPINRSISRQLSLPPILSSVIHGVGGLFKLSLLYISGYPADAVGPSLERRLGIAQQVTQALGRFEVDGPATDDSLRLLSHPIQRCASDQSSDSLDLNGFSPFLYCPIHCDHDYPSILNFRCSVRLQQPPSPAVILEASWRVNSLLKKVNWSAASILCLLPYLHYSSSESSLNGPSVIPRIIAVTITGLVKASARSSGSVV